MIKIFVSLLISIILAFPNQALAGIKSKAFIAGGSIAIKHVLKSPALRSKIVEKAKSDPQFKEKAKSVLIRFWKNPKNSNYKEKAKDMYSQIIGVPYKINGRLPQNYEFAGKIMHFTGKMKSKYPHGVPYNLQGFPDFSRYVIKEVKLEKFISYSSDFRQADKIIGINKRYREVNKLTWHHHQNGQTLQLIGKEIHKLARHNGGLSISKGTKP